MHEQGARIQDVLTPRIIDPVVWKEGRKEGSLRQLMTGGLMVVVSLTVTLLVGEVVTRGWYRRSMDFDMEFWKYATEVKVLSKNPLLGHEHRPNRRAFLMGVDVTTNSFGLRGPETTLAKRANVYRVVVIGDSLTMGWGVAQDHIYPAQLEEMLNANPPNGFPRGVRYEVLNLGIGNYNTVQEVESLRRLGVRFNPDLILLGYYINDAEPTSESDANANFLIRRSYLYSFVASRLRRLPVGDPRFHNYKEYYRSLYSQNQPGWHAARAALTELAQIGKERQIPVAMYILPELHDLSASYPFLDIDNTLIRFGDQIGLPVVDLLPAFIGHAREEELWVSPTDAHPNAPAHSMIAQEIYDSLSTGLVKPLLPPTP